MATIWEFGPDLGSPHGSSTHRTHHPLRTRRLLAAALTVGREALDTTTLMIVNKADADTTVGLDFLNANGTPGTATAFRYSGADLGAIEQLGNIAIGDTLDLPARSATLFVIEGAGSTASTGSAGQRMAPASGDNKRWAYWFGLVIGSRLGTVRDH